MYRNHFKWQKDLLELITNQYFQYQKNLFLLLSNQFALCQTEVSLQDFKTENCQINKQIQKLSFGNVMALDTASSHYQALVKPSTTPVQEFTSLILTQSLHS